MSRFPALLLIGVALSTALLLEACAPAPLYTGNSRVKGAATQGEVPRDARGEPVWSAIRPATAPDRTEGDQQTRPRA